VRRSRQILNQSGRHPEPEINSAAMRIATVIAHAVAELGHWDKCAGCHGCEWTTRPPGHGALFVTPQGRNRRLPVPLPYVTASISPRLTPD
jgi:hypothetical protein